MSKIVTAAMIVIGDEILSGRTRDANIQYVATAIAKQGIRLKEARVIPDEEDEIINTVNEMRKKHDYVFTSGGIGPTHDDITSDCVAKAFGVENKVHPVAFKILDDYFKEKNIEFTAASQRMANIPDGAKLIENRVSLAPGYQIGNVFVMAGVPRIMRDMLDGFLHTLQGGDIIVSDAIHANIAEGRIAKDLGKIQQQYPDVAIGSYPQDMQGKPGFKLIITARGTNSDDVETVCQLVEKACAELGSETQRGAAK